MTKVVRTVLAVTVGSMVAWLVSAAVGIDRNGADLTHWLALIGGFLAGAVATWLSTPQIGRAAQAPESPEPTLDPPVPDMAEMESAPDATVTVQVATPDTAAAVRWVAPDTAVIHRCIQGLARQSTG